MDGIPCAEDYEHPISGNGCRSSIHITVESVARKEIAHKPATPSTNLVNIKIVFNPYPL